MCIAILKPAGKTVVKWQLKNSFDGNRDGAGFMWGDGTKLHIDKGYFSFKKFYKAFRKAEAMYPEANFAIHFRLGTSGYCNSENCHPFIVGDNVGMMHNGIFTELNGSRQNLSDTAIFAGMLKKLPDKWFYNKAARFLVEHFFASEQSKGIIMNEKGHYLIVSEEEEGHWKEGVWFSNYGYSYDEKYVKKYDYGHYNKYDKWGRKDDTLAVTYATTDVQKNISETERKLGTMRCSKCGFIYSEEDLFADDDGNVWCLECAIKYKQNIEGWGYCWMCADTVRIENGLCTTCGTAV